MAIAGAETFTLALQGFAQFGLVARRRSLPRCAWLADIQDAWRGREALWLIERWAHTREVKPLGKAALLLELHLRGAPLNTSTLGEGP